MSKAATPADDTLPPLSPAQRKRLIFFVALSLALLVVIIAAAMIGAAGIPAQRLLAALGLINGDPAMIERDRLILWSIRLPRVAAGLIVGMLLAVSGAMMQGLFRNPLADPGLLGVSGGAALAAAIAIVIGDKLLTTVTLPIPLGLPLAAFAGALTTTAVLYRFATREGHTSIAVLLLSGLAIGALTSAAIGFLIYTADDRQLRDITFWMLGSLAGATWAKVLALTPFLLLVLFVSQYIARGLDLFVLGEAEAFHSGVEVEKMKRLGIVIVAAAAGAAVSISGVVGFVGIIVPHLLRLIIGPGHRWLLPCSALLGAMLLLGADTIARTIVAPAELPIGIITAIIGAPFFLVLLLRQRGHLGL
jgi:iron complex transport system permease protein